MLTIRSFGLATTARGKTTQAQVVHAIGTRDYVLYTHVFATIPTAKKTF